MTAPWGMRGLSSYARYRTWCPCSGNLESQPGNSPMLCSVAKLCLTLCKSMYCSPPGSFIRGVFWWIILEWVSIFFFWGFSGPRHRTCVSYIGRQIIYNWTIWEAHAVQFSSVQSLSHVQLFATPWIAARQASLSITNSWSLPKLMSIELVMPSSQSHPLLSPSPPAPNPSQHQGLFQWVNSSHEVAKVLEFQLQHRSF